MPCHQGALEGVAHFYESIIGARVDRGQGRVEVGVGVGTKLVFREAKALGAKSDEVRGFCMWGLSGGFGGI